MTLCTAFDGHKMIAAGPLAQAAAAAKAAHDAGRTVLVFRDEDARPIDLDLRGDLQAVLERLPQEQAQPEPEKRGPEKRGPGRPKLGVTPREVTLLPRHWDWLASQPGGASVVLRKLVEAALREAEGPDRMRRSREAAYRFMTAVAGDLPDYEEAVRMLFAGDWTAFDARTETWPGDVRDYARRLAEPGWRNGQGR
ncbi:DUF2239 family protein [Brevundimonas naejangsanensis]|uniref:DUF2239 family protein n=1 Tax=Brevundimonas naejangsanensis TaxID=588932 RepID=UPI0026EBEA97|nr:DUF2239 family protein [Brevundimonas naejangsanensis]